MCIRDSSSSSSSISSSSSSSKVRGTRHKNKYQGIDNRYDDDVKDNSTSSTKNVINVNEPWYHIT